MNRKVRVLVVDDSAFFRRRIVHALKESAEIEVVGEAADGREAIDQTRLHRPDVITMDVEMPKMDGITATKSILAQHKTRIIMFSALTREGARATLDALEAGATDFLAKSAADSQGMPRDIGALLRERVLALGKHQVRGAVASYSPVPARRPAGGHARQRKPIRLVVIGASTGGPVALQQILTSLPGDFPFPVLVAVHMPAAFTTTFADRLDGLCQVRVREAADGDPLRPGEVLIAPGGRQMLLTGRHGNGRVHITDVPDQVYRPSVDLTFNAAAEVYGDGVLAVVLTGMGADGSKGAGVLKRYGAQLWSQSADTCVVYGMPAAVEKAGLSDQVLALSDIGPSLARLV